MRVEVAVRVRPPQGVPGEGAVRVTRRGTLDAGGRDFAFPSTVVFGSDQAAAQAALAAPLLARLLEGFSCTLLAYGQTGSGKTHTMFGPPGSLTEESVRGCGGGEAPAAWGVFPRTVLQLLQVPGLGALHASAVEVYQEKAYDLLADRAQLAVVTQRLGTQVSAAGGKPLIIGNSHAETVNGTHPPGCRCGPCFRAGKEQLAARLAAVRGGGDAGKSSARAAHASRAGGRAGADAGPLSGGKEAEFATVGESLWQLSTPEDVARLARVVEATRIAKGHQLNARSSRSHALVHLHLTQNVGGKLSRRRFLFVDLAGSERVERSGVDGAGKKQAAAINSSLSTLGKVINELVGGSRHVSFRDSTLTQLLRSSFSGRACTAVVVNVASETAFLDETVCALHFGERLSRVTTRAEIVGVTDAAGQEASLARRLSQLEAKLAQLKQAGQGGRFGADVPASEQRSFLENMRRHDEEVATASAVKQQVAEAKAARADPGAVRALQERADRASAEAANLRDILLRQKSIKGFFFAPSPQHAQLEAERKQVAAELGMLRGSRPEGHRETVASAPATDT
jgi:hypothetical protein